MNEMIDESGWINCCKKHLRRVKSDCKKNKKVLQGTADADKRSRCDVPKCKERAYYECYIGKKSFADIIAEGKFVPWNPKGDNDG